jgi:hypothetical protein
LFYSVATKVVAVKKAIKKFQKKKKPAIKKKDKPVAKRKTADKK